MSRDPAEKWANALLGAVGGAFVFGPCCLKFALGLVLVAALLKWMAT